MGRRLRPAALLALLVAVGWWVDRPFRESLLVSDDQIHLDRTARLVQGKLGWSEYLLELHNVHFVPAWRLWFYGQWRLSGLDPAGYHLSVSLVHALAGWFLALLVAHATSCAPAAVVAGVLWAGSAFGRGDQPLNWLGASHLTFGIAGLLGAMLATAHSAGRHPRACDLAMAGGVAWSILSMGSFLLFAPLVVVQYFWIARAPGPLQGRDAAWLAAWSAAVVVPGALFAWSAWSYEGVGDTRLGSAHPIALAWPTLVHFLLALANLAGVSPATDPRQALLARAATAAVVLAVAVGGSRPAARRLLVLVLVLAVAHTYLSCLRTADDGLDKILASARYGYLPALFWCLAVALAAATVLDSAGPRRRLLLIAGGALLVAFVARQAVIAEQSARRFREITRHEELAARREGFHRLLALLDAQACSEGRPLLLPDVELVFPAMLPHRLADFVGFAFARPPAGIEVRPAEQLAPQERAVAVERLRRLGDPLADELAAAIQSAR